MTPNGSGPYRGVCEHQPSLARAIGASDLRPSRQVMLTPHNCLDCGALVYTLHQTPRFKPWKRSERRES